MSTAPSVTSIAFDKTAYNTGDLMTATVTYVPGKSDKTSSFSTTLTDPVTSLTATLAGNYTVHNVVTDTTEVTVSDAGGRTWTKVSDTGTVAKFTATA